MKVHLVMKKEEIDHAQMDEQKVAVVFDVLLATSTITACLDFGAKQVLPVMNEAEALQEAKQFAKNDAVLVGEYNGVTIEGFLDPAPLALKKHVAGKTVVLSTTNGTVAIRKSAGAGEVYVASILNGEMVSKQVTKVHTDKTIMVVCSGSKDRFCLEDFYGAGYFISQLVKASDDSIDLTDSARTAMLFYENTRDQNILRQSRVGKRLERYGANKELDFINQEGLSSVVPRLVEGKLVCMDSSVREGSRMTGGK